MAKKEVHTVPKGNGWANETAGGSVISNHRRKDTAQAAGRKQAISRKAEHVIHKKDGTIGTKNSYGNDPRRSKG